MSHKIMSNKCWPYSKVIVEVGVWMKSNKRNTTIRKHNHIYWKPSLTTIKMQYSADAIPADNKTLVWCWKWPQNQLTAWRFSLPPSLSTPSSPLFQTKGSPPVFSQHYHWWTVKKKKKLNFPRSVLLFFCF